MIYTPTHTPLPTHDSKVGFTPLLKLPRKKNHVKTKERYFCLQGPSTWHPWHSCLVPRPFTLAFLRWPHRFCCRSRGRSRAAGCVAQLCWAKSDPLESRRGEGGSVELGSVERWDPYRAFRLRNGAARGLKKGDCPPCGIRV